MAEYARKYRENHRAKVAEKESRRREAFRTCPVKDFTRAQWEHIKEAFLYRCAYCGIVPPKLTKDHVIPVQHGGFHTAANIVPACAPCNSSKGYKPVVPPMAVIPTHHSLFLGTT